jgi:hypothetical protein
VALLKHLDTTQIALNFASEKGFQDKKIPGIVQYCWQHACKLQTWMVHHHQEKKVLNSELDSVEIYKQLANELEEKVNFTVLTE